MPGSDRAYRTLTSALEAVRVHSPTSYSWLGHRTPPLPSVVGKVIKADAARDYLRHTLQQRLYRQWYRLGAPASADALDPGARPTALPTPFLAALSKANCGTGPHESGWQVHAIDGDLIVIQRDGLRLWARPDDIASTDGTTPSLATPITVHLPKELLRASPGFYLALGDKELPPPGREPIVRLYWNISVNAAPHLMESVTSKLNEAGVPFRCKMISAPDTYARCDAAVLYLPKRCYPSAEEILAAIHHGLRADIGDAVPALTKQLAPGLGLAEDPGDGNSFGMHRCDLVAEGIIRAREHRLRSVQKRLAIVLTCFSEAGIDGDHPYLNPGSVDTYSAFDCSTR
jgi:hypothetical protein